MLQSNYLGQPFLVDTVANLRKNGFRGLNNEKGIYCWWFDEEITKSFIEVLNEGVVCYSSKISLYNLRSCTFEGKEYYALYVGSASRGSIKERLKGHINQSPTPSVIANEALSTLRHTITALLGIEASKGEDAVNQLMDEHCVVECWEIPQDKIEDYEKNAIIEGACLLNIQNNNQFNNQIKNRISELRKMTNK